MTDIKTRMKIHIFNMGKNWSISKYARCMSKWCIHLSRSLLFISFIPEIVLTLVYISNT